MACNLNSVLETNKIISRTGRPVNLKINQPPKNILFLINNIHFLFRMAELVQDASQFLTGDIFATEVRTRILVFTLHVDCYFLFFYCTCRYM